jgi:hypothetical protein
MKYLFVINAEMCNKNPAGNVSNLPLTSPLFSEITRQVPCRLFFFHYGHAGEVGKKMLEFQ